ncbi:MAG: hemolysin D, partial [Planctomycetaceae bacterium]
AVWVPRRIHALGRLEPRGKVIRLAPPSGNDAARVEVLLVKEGDVVPAHSIVALLDTNARRQAELLEAEAKQKSAEARLAQTRAGAKSGEILAQRAAVDLLAEQKKVSLRELERVERFRSQKVISNEDYDKHKWTYDRVVFELQRAEQLLSSISEVREIDVRVQELEVAAAAAAVAAAQSRLAASEVRNPSAGRVLKIHTQPGERVGDVGLMELGDVDRMQAVAEVFEGDVSALEAGLPAVVRVDSTGERFEGEVEELGSLVGRKVVLTNDPVSDTDARVVEVRIRLSESDSLRVARLSNARVEVTVELPAAKSAAPPPVATTPAGPR